MYKQIKDLADEAIALQNKNGMDAALREISALCGLAGGDGSALVGFVSTSTGAELAIEGDHNPAPSDFPAEIVAHDPAEAAHVIDVALGAQKRTKRGGAK